MPDLGGEAQQANSQDELGPAAAHPENAAVIIMETDDVFRQTPSFEIRLQLNVWKLLPVYGAIFLAPIIIVLGLTASHGDSWKIIFVVSFVSWMVICGFGLFLDLRGLEKKTLLRRSLWHLGGCLALLYFAVSVLHIDSDALPQWLPTIIDCGLCASIGFQNISGSSRKRLWDYACKVLHSIFGGTQVILQQGQESLLPREERR